MAGVECTTRHVTFDLAGSASKSVVVGEAFASPATTRLVMQHGFDVQPGVVAEYAAQHVQARHATASPSLPATPATPTAVDESDAAEETAFAAAAAAVGGFKAQPGVRGLLDLSNASSGTPGACSLSSSAALFDTSPSSHVEVTATAHVTPGVARLVKSVQRGLRACQDPEAAEQGLGGTYFFMNEAGRKVAIMKPCDEEPLAPNNPKGFVGRALGDLGLKPTVRVGEAAMREVAAYLLDHDHWARVPHTALVRLSHPVFHVSPAADGSGTPLALRRSGSSRSSLGATTSSGGLDSVQSAAFAAAGAEGAAADAPPCAAQTVLVGSPADGVPCKLGSLQEFVAHDCDTSEMGPSRFATRDVHRIGILDVRLLNTDRHAGNMLVRRPRVSASASSANLAGGGGGLARLDERQLELVPIDHGFCLPEALEPPYFEWLYWPQAMIPFGEEELEYIARLDARRDCQLLRDNLPNLPEGCHRTLEVCTTLLQRGAAAGLSLFEIGSALSRPLVGMDEELSELEKACAAARSDFEARREAGADADSEDAESDDDEFGLSDDDDDDDDSEPEPPSDGEFALLASAVAPAGGAGHGAAVAPAAANHKPPLHPSQQQQQQQQQDDEQLLFSFEDERTGSASSPGNSPGRGHGGAARKPPLPGSRSFNVIASDCGPAAAAATALATPVAVVNPSRRCGSPGNSRRVSFDGCASSAGAGASGGQQMESPFAELAAAGGVHASAVSASSVLGAGVGVNAAAPCCAKSLGTAAGAAFSSVAARRARRRSHSHAAPKGAHRKASKYPPPVRAAPPEAVSAMFEGLEDEDDWRQFMRLLEARIDAALAAGGWRASSGVSSHAQLGMSCPKF